MTLADGPQSAALSRRTRYLAALVGAALTAALLLASQLRPDPRGWGTHEQLGLPRCTFLALTGTRCPACGMTTAWSQVMHGQLTQAVRTHASGALLALIALVAGPTALVVAARGKLPVRMNSEIAAAVAAVALAGLVICEWLVRLWTQ